MNLQEGTIVRVRAAQVEVRSQPELSSSVICMLCQGVFLTCREVNTVQQSIWIRIDCGWIIALRDRKEEPLVCIVTDPAVAEFGWQEETKELQRMAAAVVSALIRNHPLPRAKRLGQSLCEFAESRYPQRAILREGAQPQQEESLEDVMIHLTGRGQLSKKKLFEYIKVAAFRHSNPPNAVLSICQEVKNIFTQRPSGWVLEDLPILITEDKRIQNNEFVMLAAEGRLKEFCKCLAEGQEVATSWHSDLRFTALHAAAEFGQLEILRAILQTGVSVNLREPYRGRTALHCAAAGGRFEALQLLLAAGADRLMRTLRGTLAYEMAARQQHEECADLLKFLPPAVQHVKIEEVTTTGIRISWIPPTLHPDHHARIEEYAAMICEERLAFEEYDRLPSIITRKTEMLFSSLFSSVLYKARVRCRTASGWSNWSVWATGRTRPAPPDAPPPLEIVKVSVNGLFLKWDPPLRDNGFPIDHYLLEVADEQLVGVTTALDASLLDDREGGASKSHRLVKHKEVSHLYRYLPGLEPGRHYRLRARAHNKLGYGLFSEWSRSIAPQCAITIQHISGSPSSSAASMAPSTPSIIFLKWFAPVLNPENTVACYEVQLARLAGAEGEGGKEFYTLTTNQLTNDYRLEGLQAGARYQARVRPRIKSRAVEGYGQWLDWEQAVISEPFAVPAARPDPPTAPLPMRTASAAASLNKATSLQLARTNGNIVKSSSLDPVNETKQQCEGSDHSDHGDSDTHSDEEESVSHGVEGRMEKSSLATTADSASSHFFQPQEIPSSILAGTSQIQSADKRTNPSHALSSVGMDANPSDPSLNDQWEIGYDYVELTWQPGIANGEPITEVEIYRATVRLYSCQDLLKISSLLCNRDAYEGLDGEGDQQSYDEVSSQSVGSSGGSSESYSSQEKEELEWLNVSQTGGIFHSMQSFRATELLPGQAYCFKARQKNKLGWSDFSLPSPIIGTYPSAPPCDMEVIHITQTFVIMAVTTTCSFSTLQYEVQSRISSDGPLFSSGGLVDSTEGSIPWQTMPFKILDRTYCERFIDEKSRIINPKPRSSSSSKLMSHVIDDVELLEQYHDLLAPCEDEKSQSSHKMEEKKVVEYLQVSGLVEGQNYALRVKRRTVLGWSPFDETSTMLQMRR